MRDVFLVVLVATVALVSGTTPATARDQSVADKAVTPPEEPRAPKGVEGNPCKPGYQRDSTGVCLRLGDYGSSRRRRRLRVCEEYEIDATGQRGKCLKYKPVTRKRRFHPRVKRVRSYGREYCEYFENGVCLRCKLGYRAHPIWVCFRPRPRGDFHFRPRPRRDFPIRRRR